jgi:cyclopropane-fatty-acyl-phospholipid synthase
MADEATITQPDEIPAGTLGGLLAEVLGGRLELGIRTWEGIRLGPPGAPAALVVRSRDALARVLQRPGQLGLARAFVAGDLDVEGDILEAVQRASALEGVRPTRAQWVELARLAGPGALLPRRPPPEEARLDGRVHSVRRDRRAVKHHYDVSNDFYRVLLGSSMTYSCACWTSPGDTLEAAQAAKHELVARKLDLAPGARLLDVGCGWGAMLEHAAVHHGARGVGVTLSENQRAWAAKRMAEVGADMEVRVQDYRLVEDGPFDAISSVGMSEHVGQANLPTYFAKLFELLRPGGRLLNHAISALPTGRRRGDWPTPVQLPAALRARRSRSGEAGFAGDSFISRYIFPDGELIEVGAVVSAMQRAGFEVRHVESLREHYGLTLRRWLANLEEHWAQAVAEVGERRCRAWRLYLAGSAWSFETGRIAVHQVLGVKPDGGRSGMPLRPQFG